MTKIWTLSTCGTGGRVCSASNLIGARRKPGGRRPGNPVSRRATKNRFFVHVPSSSSSTRPAPLRFFSVRVVAPRAECKRASNISPILSSAFTSNRSATILLWNFVPTNCWTIHQYRRKLRFWKLASARLLLTRTCALSSPFSPFARFWSTRACESKIRIYAVLHLFRIFNFDRKSKIDI